MKYPLKLISHDLVSVKPLSAPTGQIFYMDFKYNDDPNIKRKALRKNRKDKFKELFENI